jgi:hypothetical protein
VVAGLFASKGPNTTKSPAEISAHSKDALASTPTALDSQSGAPTAETAAPAQDGWWKRPSILFAHPPLPPLPQQEQEAGGVNGPADKPNAENDERSHADGVRGMPGAGLVSLWNRRDELWSIVAEKADGFVATHKSSAGGPAAGLHTVAVSAAVPRGVQVGNPLRFLGRDEWLALIPLQVCALYCPVVRSGSTPKAYRSRKQIDPESISKPMICVRVGFCRFSCNALVRPSGWVACITSLPRVRLNCGPQEVARSLACLHRVLLRVGLGFRV